MKTFLREALFMENTETKPNFARLAEKYNCDYRTIKRYYENRDALPHVRKKREIPLLVNQFKRIIEEKYVDYGAPAIEIYNFIKKKGYKGSYSTVKRFCRTLKDDKTEEATIHFETFEGEQCQIDWKEDMILENIHGEIFEINIFLAILGFSRKKYIELTLDKTQPTLFKCLTNTIKYYGGTPKQFLFDNMKTVVDQSRTCYGKPVYNDVFYAFSKDAGFIPRSCLAFKPQTKGKIETVAKLMNRLRTYNREFETLDDLRNIVSNLLEEINNEIHSITLETPNNRFLKEKEYLNKEPNYDALEDYFSPKPLVRKVNKDSLIVFGCRRYSLPPEYIGKQIRLVKKENMLYLYYNNNLICVHEIQNRKINYIPEHYEAIVKTNFKKDEGIAEFCERNLQLFDKL